MPYLFGGEEVSEQRGIDVASAVMASPILVLDTANGYSGGNSENRIGEAIRRMGGLPGEHWISTKVSAENGDYSGARVERSVEESLDRLGLDKLPLIFLHDPEFSLDQDLEGPGGAIETLLTLRDSGVVEHLGVAGGNPLAMRHFLEIGVFEVLLTHNRWTLVDRSADDLISYADMRGIGVMNAAYLGGGFLTSPQRSTNYGYSPANQEVLRAGKALDQLCSRWGTDLATAALQFSMRDPRIHTSVVGISRPERVRNLLDAVGVDLPRDFWSEVEDLLPPPEYWLDPPRPHDE
ncbi:aldo/keto reductase [Nocardioides sp. SYSU D00038]|uniref:aldo/keto reductase n=1 Tax=Nocardioides sp. SYSU D00038 TaxID=2812554 RepID=UPI001F082859|nr:aldo/keto reductase [Nocardioides sp. SYSU D00038]